MKLLDVLQAADQLLPAAVALWLVVYMQWHARRLEEKLKLTTPADPPRARVHRKSW